MAVYLAIPPKTTSEVDLIKPLKNFIKSNFSDTPSEDYEKALNDFHRLRNQAIGKFNDKHESAIEAVGKYYDQFVEVEKKLPFTEDQVRINFTWYDAFSKPSVLSGRPKLAIPSGSFEKAAMLFNLAAIQTQVASVQSKDSDDGLKLSAKLLQQSSGILKYLKENVMSLLGRDPTPDMHPDTLSALSALMLAQAQESIYQKTAIDKMKDAIVAKIAMQCSVYYADALKLLQLYSVKEIWPKDWIPTVAGKQAAFHALAEYYQSGAASSSKAYGEEIARLQQARELTQAAISRGGREVDFNNQLSKINVALEKAKKDNDFIYHDRVPDHKTLPAVGKAPVAKPLPVPDKMSSSFKDLFEKLVPLAIHGALAAYESRKGQLINTEVGRMRDATATLNGVLASLNLPAAIEDVSGTELPSSVQEKASHVQSMGGLATLDRLLQELPDALTRNREILDESFKMLDDEEAADKQLREQFGSKWTRTPSAKLTETLRSDGNKYRSILSNAVQADAIVKEKYNTHKEGFQMLSSSVADIQAALPSSSSLGALKDSGEVKQLRSLMQEVNALKQEREALEKELKDTKSDMLSKFVGALASDGAVDEETLSGAELQTIYGPITNQINESLSKQEALLAQIQSTHEKFSRAKMGDQTGAKREEILRRLAAAYDAFNELKANLEEGTKFYNDLTPIVVKYQSKISDLCFARKTEKDELLKDLNQQIANQPSQSAPAVPSYQNPKPAAGPPKRPPPPTTTGASTAAAPPPVAAQPPSHPPSAMAAPPAQAPAAAAVAPPAQTGASAPTTNPGYPQQQPVAPGQSYQNPSYPYYNSPMPTGYNPYGYGYPAAPPAGPGYSGYGMPQPPYPTQGQPQQYPPQQQYQPPSGYPYPPQPGYPYPGQNQ